MLSVLINVHLYFAVIREMPAKLDVEFSKRCYNHVHCQLLYKL